MQRRQGFTLVEMIAVVAIIAIVMAILLPVLAQARREAFVATDVEQMRQVYLAVVSYEEDYDELSPHSLLYTEPYAKSTRVFSSPVDPWRDGVPGFKDFPADMYVIGNDGLSDGLRSPFRISYGYLYPMAKWFGCTDAWFQRARALPAFSILAMRMYSDVPDWPPTQPQDDIDLNRWNNLIYRIRMDGSLQVSHGPRSLSPSCALDQCFGVDGSIGWCPD